MHLRDAHRCCVFYSHSLPLPTKMADHREEWADTLTPLGHKHTSMVGICPITAASGAQGGGQHQLCVVSTQGETLAAWCPRPVFHFLLHLQNLQVHLELTAVLLMLQQQRALIHCWFS